MKEGYYTIIDGKEYRVSIWTDMSDKSNVRNRYYICTENLGDADDTFTFDDSSKEYVKEIDKSSLGEVLDYRIQYFYNGYPVCRIGIAGDEITIGLGMKDKTVADSLGFTLYDRDGYIKKVNISEVEIKQDKPRISNGYI